MTLTEVFEGNIKDIYHAEKQLTKALPKLVKKATDADLKQTLESHLGETEEHISRLEQVAEMLGIKPTGKVCHGMMGLIEETNEHVGELKPGATMDAVIIECAQKAEHYEIATYGTICEWGKILGKDKAVALLKQNMADEENADVKLSKIAETVVNSKAFQEETSMGKKPMANRSNGQKSPRAKAGTATR